MKGNKKIKKGFTLIELLVVIAIIAILSVVVILTLNPAELLRQSRDSNRISDLSVTKSAIAFYLASVSSGISIGSSTYCYVDASGIAPGVTREGTSTCLTMVCYRHGLSFGGLDHNWEFDVGEWNRMDSDQLQCDRGWWFAVGRRTA